MSTKELARELGLLRQRSKSSDGSKKFLVSNQIFSHLIVIDFESTCWSEKNNNSQEIIEFPAVLLNTSTGEVESEFHTYVQPEEHPVLSKFCTELTGITQEQVEAGIPLHICLSRFSRWLQRLQLQMSLAFPNAQQQTSANLPPQKLCTFLTWSDWDLGVCLQYECKRKQLHKPDVLNSWIDLRSTYRLFYDRKPKGLNGALQDLGIQFSGREHSGLDDARNTAQLAAKMMRDGCVMKTTKSLARSPLMVKPMFGNTATDNRKGKASTKKEENTLTTNKASLLKIWQTESKSVSAQDSVPTCQSLIWPETLLNGTISPLWRHHRRSATAGAPATILSLSVNTSPATHNDENKSLVLCSTTVGCLSDQLPPNHPSDTGTLGGNLGEEEVAELSVETEERCGSYDDMVMEEGNVISTGRAEFDTTSLYDFDSGSSVWAVSGNTSSSGVQVTLRDKGKETASVENCRDIKSQMMSSESLPAKKMRFCINKPSNSKEIQQHQKISESRGYFVIPSALPQDVTSNENKMIPKSNEPLKNTKAHFPLRHKPFTPGKTFTSNTLSFRDSKCIVQCTKKQVSRKSYFGIFCDEEKKETLHDSSYTPKNVFCSLSTNTPSSRFTMAMKGQRITSPLCACGHRAKQQVVSRVGPNHGRRFYCCRLRGSAGSGRIQKGCEFFQWESALVKRSSEAFPTVSSSVSVCQTNWGQRSNPKLLARKSC